MRHTTKITLCSPQKTCDFAQKIAVSLTRGDVILLQGGIGAGKTHFARCLIQSLLDIPEDIPSPTFTLVQTYKTRLCDLWHADLYRLSHPDEVIELGLQDAFTEDICLVEWPDRLGDLTPEHALMLQFDPSEHPEERIATLTWTNSRWSDLLKSIIDDK